MQQLEQRFQTALRSIRGTFGPPRQVQQLGRELFAAHIGDFFSRYPSVAAISITAEGGPARIVGIELTDESEVDLAHPHDVARFEADLAEQDSVDEAELAQYRAHAEIREQVEGWAQHAQLGRFALAMGDRDARLALRVTRDAIQPLSSASATRAIS